MARDTETIDRISLAVFTARAQLHCLSMLLTADDYAVFPSNQILADTLHGIAANLERAYDDMAEV